MSDSSLGSGQRQDNPFFQNGYFLGGVVVRMHGDGYIRPEVTRIGRQLSPARTCFGNVVEGAVTKRGFPSRSPGIADVACRDLPFESLNPTVVLRESNEFKGRRNSDWAVANRETEDFT